MSSEIVRIIFGFTQATGSLSYQGKTIIDFGCGYGKWAHLIRCEIGKGSNTSYIVGCDIYKPYLRQVKKYNPYDDLVLCDVRRPPFHARCCDIALALEVLEHLEKHEAILFLQELPQLAKQITLISTPRDFYPQNVLGGNQYQRHRSAWTADELKSRGYMVIETGLGYDLEQVLKRLHIFRLFYHINKKRSKSSWGGVMLFCSARAPVTEKKHRIVSSTIPQD